MSDVTIEYQPARISNVNINLTFEEAQLLRLLIGSCNGINVEVETLWEKLTRARIPRPAGSIPTIQLQSVALVYHTELEEERE